MEHKQSSRGRPTALRHKTPHQSDTLDLKILLQKLQAAEKHQMEFLIQDHILRIFMLVHSLCFYLCPCNHDRIPRANQCTSQ